jgi:hypothetical protein
LAILKASLVLLLFANFSFLGILGYFHYLSSATKGSNGTGNGKNEALLAVLYAAGLLILVRNIFRTVQIFSSSYSPAWKTEALFWVFDAAPLLISTLLLNISHMWTSAPSGGGGDSCA